MKPWLTLMLSTAFVSVCMGQTGSGSQPSHEGPFAENVYLTVSTSNSTFRVGSNVEFHAEVRNSSTNQIILGESNPSMDFIVSLISGERRYRLNHERILYTGLSRLTLNPGENRNWKVSVPIGHDVPPGNYEMEVTRSVSISNQPYRLVSNHVQVQIQ